MVQIFREKINHVPIVGDGAIGDPRFGNGRVIPVLIVDCSAHTPLEDLILAHRDTPPGDVRTAWSWHLLCRKKVYLNFKFERPIETAATLTFDVARQGGIVDCIINVRGIYLQPLSSGKKVSEGMHNPKILVEVPPSSTFPTWKDTYRRSVERLYLERGLSRKQSKVAAEEHIKRQREIQFRQRPL